MTEKDRFGFFTVSWSFCFIAMYKSVCYSNSSSNSPLGQKTMPKEGKVQEKKLKVLFLSSEASPYAKTGGLGDVSGALPREIKKLGVDIRLVIPFYWSIKKTDVPTSLVTTVDIPMGEYRLKAEIRESVGEGGLRVYFIDREDMYQRPNLYGGACGDYYDNFERFVFFSLAALNFFEGVTRGVQIIHCNDWQTGLVPALVRARYSKHKALSQTRTVFTIHNIGYQGIFPREKMRLTGLDEKEFFHPEALEYWGKISLLKAGIVFSDAITTVSPRYAQELQSHEYGMGMEGILSAHRHKLQGILNGVDEDQWDPSKDRYLSAHYHRGHVAGKKINKEALKRELGLKGFDQYAPILCVVTRLDKQKGLDLLLQIIDEVLREQAYLVILASGDGDIARDMQYVTARYAGRIAFIKDFDEPLAHRIIAGSDILLMPSRYEPCGLTQMYALKYGTIPVVRATGGLDDTVQEFDARSGQGNGFKFSSYDPDAFLKAIMRALSLYSDRRLWQKIVKNAMECDFSWRRSAEHYLKLYQSILTES